MPFRGAKRKGTNLFPMAINKRGRWWQKAAEIDIVGLDEVNNKILFAECKWGDDINASALLKQLQESAQLVDWKQGDREEFYVLFARTFNRKVGNQDNVKYINIDAMQEFFDQSHD